MNLSTYKFMMHVPALLKEVIQYLELGPNQNLIDCTIGGGGHSFALLNEIKPNGKILGIDANPDAISALQKLKVNNLILVNDNFRNLKVIVEKEKIFPVHGILLDLGLSSDILESSGRGFSFRKDENLDMRFNPQKEILTAQIILNQWPADQLIDIFKKFGEEKYSKLIVRQIVIFRTREQINITSQLVGLIKSALGKKFNKKSLARIFQALRIAVNNELDNLEKILPQAVEILESGGRLAVVSYHSLEDRRVKYFFKNNPSLKILTKKPVRPTLREIEQNPRSRSAKLRVAEKII